MKIERRIQETIISAMPNTPPEIGGIIGGGGGIVNSWLMDVDSSSKGCYYSPNVSKLNRAIHIWQRAGIEFMGLFHVHYWGVQTLSDGDKSYIIKIMQAMPEQIKLLYFPVVVIPDRKMVPYVAQRRENLINIREDSLLTV